MKIKLYVFSSLLVLFFVLLIVFALKKPKNESVLSQFEVVEPVPSNLSTQSSFDKLDVLKKENMVDLKSTPIEKFEADLREFWAGLSEDMAKKLSLELETERKKIEAAVSQMTYEESVKESIKGFEALMHKAKKEQDWESADYYHGIISDLKENQEWEAGRPQREAAREQRRLETEAFEREMEIWVRGNREGLEKLKQMEIWMRMRDSGVITAVPELESPSDAAASESESPSASAVLEPSSDAPNEISVSSDEPASPSSTFDAVKSLSTVQRTLTPWRKDIEDKYFDVIVSQYMTPKEVKEYFPMETDRQMLKLRTMQLQKTVVSKIRKVVSDLPNASAEQKRAFARELVTQNFEKDFAESVLKALEAETD